MKDKIISVFIETLSTTITQAVIIASMYWPIAFVEWNLYINEWHWATRAVVVLMFFVINYKLINVKLDTKGG